MSNKTVEVELDNGYVRPSGSDILPARAHALLTLLDDTSPATARTCGELADRWLALEKLPREEAISFANDIEQSRASLLPLKTAWD